MCGVAMPVFGPGGEVVAAVEFAVSDLGRNLQPILGALTIATRSLSRELTGAAQQDSMTSRVDELVPAAVG